MLQCIPEFNGEMSSSEWAWQPTSLINPLTNPNLELCM
jgi:hypothetical protein